MSYYINSKLTNNSLMRNYIVFACAVLILIGGFSNAHGKSVSKSNGILINENGKLDVNIDSKPLKTIMDEFSRMTGVQIVWVNNEIFEPVSVGFKNRTIDEAVKYILSGKSHLLHYSNATMHSKLTEVWIITGDAKGGDVMQTHSQPYPLAYGNPSATYEQHEVLLSQIESLEMHMEMGNREMAIVEAVGLLETSFDPVMKVMAIDFLEMIDYEPVDEILEVLNSDPEPMLHKRVTEYLAKHEDKTPMINNN